MSIKALNIETVFSGLIHLVWLTLLTLCILGKSPDVVFCYLEQVESGTAVILIAILFSVSFFLGRMAEHLIIALNYFRKNEKDREKSLELYKDNQGEIWGNKIFSVSSFCAILLVVLFLLLLPTASKVRLAILILGLILLSTTIISSIYWYNFEKRKTNSERK
jgi:O-antigen/teichoic acid export membrane protein